MNNNEREDKEECLKLLEVYRNILAAYELCRKVFQVLYHYIWLAIIVWLIKTFVIITTLSLYCEKFNQRVAESKEACIQLTTNENCPRCYKYLYKKVSQLNRSFSKMTVLGMFCIDATLPTSLISIVTHYLIVLMQFHLK
ncbi:hypothetical protein HF086_006401 [Spodoptera exigua]|uniref:Uncharacterized protein n=1 Tax=Spodoptera exigua TaxID=7107 RepID=A0A922SPB0_SPOEX|nr:hypothetical protein HF086_006401 [Spodoptera exigua]